MLFTTLKKEEAIADDIDGGIVSEMLELGTTIKDEDSITRLLKAPG